MASLDSLPPDQRAVLQLVLQRGRSYDDIAQLLSIDRAAVRERALAAFDALGPQTRVLADRRALITDYLLGQLPPKVADETRDRLADSAGERAWARVLASELGPLAGGNLPEIPAEGARSAPAAAPPAEAADKPVAAPTPRRERKRPEPSAPAIPADYGAPKPEPAGGQPRSRTGGMILIGLGAVVVIVVVVILIASGGSSKSTTTPTTAGTPTTGTTPATGTTPTTSTTANGAKVIAQFNLSSPTSKKTVGIVEVLRQSNKEGIAIVAQGVPANTTHNAYAVWLYNSPTDAQILGFVSPGVGKTGRLSTAGPLPTNASHFKEMLVTLETQAKPKAPGTIVLQGNLTLS
jgi:Sigma-70, region 4